VTFWPAMTAATRSPTPHTMGHTFASLLAALGKDPGHIMDPARAHRPGFTFRVYRHSMRRDDGERDALRSLWEGTYEWAPVPKSDPIEPHPTPSAEGVGAAESP